MAKYNVRLQKNIYFFKENIMIYASKTFKFSIPLLPFARDKKFDELLHAAKEVKLVPNQNSISASNEIAYLLQELKEQNESEIFREVAVELQRLSVQEKDYASLFELERHKDDFIFSDEANELLIQYNAMVTTTRYYFEEVNGCNTPFERKEPFPMRFYDGRLSFTAPNGVEYRVYRVDYSEFGTRG